MAEEKKLSLKDLQKNQPSFMAEMRAQFRQGREDLLSTIMGPVAGTTREPGAPGTPTQQQTNAALGGLSLDDLLGYAKDRAKEAEQKMDRGHDRGGIDI